MAIPLLGLSAEAHAPTFTGARQLWTCTAAWAGASVHTHVNQGPADKTWTVKAGVGLNGGADTVQYGRFGVIVYDPNNQNQRFLNQWEATVRDWQGFGVTQRTTLTTHSEGTINIMYWIQNNDGAAQCYSWVIDPYWW